MTLIEANIDGLVGPTHNYAGLSFGNVASGMHAGKAANPRAAVLQGLQKMRELADLGIPQFVLPPHPRPNARLLASLGLRGNVKQMLAQAAARVNRCAPHICRVSPRRRPATSSAPPITRC